MITVKVGGAVITGKLRNRDGDNEIAVPKGTTVRELLEILADSFGEDLRNMIYQNEKRELRKGLRFLLNRMDIDTLEGLENVLHDGDSFFISFLLAGG